eukprot:Hpha_TRINITY_DN12280_c1_g1::TRINITY_DN12280_c1_g1_i1::g.16847::m.16847
MCAGAGNMSCLLFLLSLRGLEVNSRNDMGCTPLWGASVSAQPDAIRALIFKGKADPNLPTYHGCTPLMASAWYGYKDCVEVLVKEGGVEVNSVTHVCSHVFEAKKPGTADIFKEPPEDQLGWSACHFAVHGAPPPESRGGGARSRAAAQRADVLRVLIAAGCDVNIRSAAGWTPSPLP